MTGPGTALLILGMHRSGTSAITRVLNLLGVNLGRNLLKGAAAMNARGFWENRALIDAHDRLLEEALASGWFDTRPLPDGWWRGPSIPPRKAEIREALRRDIGDPGLFAVKDPRLCRLMPLWREMLTEDGVCFGCILIVRHPEEVARSLRARDGFDLRTGRRLWLRYVLESERHTRGTRRTLIGYDELLEDPGAVLRRITDRLDVRWPDASDESRKRVNEELSRDLRHHAVDADSPADDDPLSSTAIDVYRAMRSSPLNDLAPMVDDALATLNAAAMTVRLDPDALFHLNRGLVFGSRDLNRARKEIQALQTRGEEHRRRIAALEERPRAASPVSEEQLRKLTTHWSWPLVKRLAGWRS